VYTKNEAILKGINYPSLQVQLFSFHTFSLGAFFKPVSYNHCTRSFAFIIHYKNYAVGTASLHNSNRKEMLISLLKRDNYFISILFNTYVIEYGHMFQLFSYITTLYQLLVSRVDD
jgi:hypothetical protein